MIHGTHNAVDDPRNKEVLVYVNGELLPRQDAKISIFDSGYLVGDGVWEGLRLHDGVLVFLDEHLDRLYQGAATIGMDHKELTSVLHRTLDANRMHDGVHVRLMLTRGIKKTLSQDPRLNCHSKLHEVQALIKALEAGADEALMLDIHGFVATCNATNFFMVHKGEVVTSTGQYCMNGITRGKIITACREHDIPFAQKNFSLFDVYGADEAFVTGIFGGLTPVTGVDGRPIGSYGPLTKKLQTHYDEAVQRAVALY